jgi:amidase
MQGVQMSGFFVPHDLKAPLRGAATGPLAGLSAVVKDMYAIAGERTGAGTPIGWRRRSPPTQIAR